MLKYIFYYLIVTPLNFILFFIIFSNFKWYRKLKGGTWYKYFLRPIPYIHLWTRDELLPWEIQMDKEYHGKIIIK